MIKPATTDFPRFEAPYAGDDDQLIRHFASRLSLSDSQNGAVDRRATTYIEAIRSNSGSVGGVEDFLREYGLSTREGLALMVLAEALLRVPDALTQDRLIEDKLKEGGWSEHEAHGDSWFVSASAWALGLSARVIRPGETPEGVMRGLVKRLGLPTVRSATKQAMRFSAITSCSAKPSRMRSRALPRARSVAIATPSTCWARAPGPPKTPSAISSPMPAPSRRSARIWQSSARASSCQTAWASRSSSRRCIRVISRPIVTGSCASWCRIC